MTHNNIKAALVISYRRFGNVSEIIDLLITQGIKRIYIAIDHNPIGDKDAAADVMKTLSVAIEKNKNSPGNINIALHDNNAGCAAAVLSACDWFFKNEEFGLILEDDCIPSKEFFSYANQAKAVIEESSDIWLFCGTQFAPKEKTIDYWSLSSYALTWGWGTSNRNWEQISHSIKDDSIRIVSNNASRAEKNYWNAGAKRSSSGVVDAWDNILIQKMLALRKKAILPRDTLVSNIGNDPVATHTLHDSNWLNMSTGQFGSPSNIPIINFQLDSWLRSKFYQISKRHIFSTRLTYFFDSLMRRRSKSVKLAIRWEQANADLRVLDQATL